MRWEGRLQNHTATAKTKVRQTSACIDTCTAFATFNVAFFGGRSASCIGADAVTRCVPGGIIAVGITIIGINVAVWCPFPETAKEEGADGLRDDAAVPVIVPPDFGPNVCVFIIILKTFTGTRLNMVQYICICVFNHRDYYCT
ncbi:hypothetical protein GQX74_002852 [Glossina fuscipes]|nr:hypothetical protein GQX74_002852 [Glossina fuscipes]